MVVFRKDMLIGLVSRLFVYPSSNFFDSWLLLFVLSFGGSKFSLFNRLCSLKTAYNI